MTASLKKYLFLFVWVIVLIIGPFTVIHNTSLIGAVGNKIVLINLLQRVIGLMAFSLLISQIVVGILMHKLIEKLGGWIFNFHKVEGFIVWGLIFIHPLLFIIANFFQFGLSGTLSVIVPRISTYSEILYSLGKLAFIFITIAVVSGFYRDKPVFRKIWKKLHFLNYAAFTAIALHTYLLGTDSSKPPFFWLYWLSIGLVAGLVIYRIVNLRKISA